MIIGSHPWYKGKKLYSLEEVKQKVKNKIPFYLSKNTSNEMKKFLYNMISKNPESRLSASELLKQEFLNSNEMNYEQLNDTKIDQSIDALIARRKSQQRINQGYLVRQQYQDNKLKQSQNLFKQGRKLSKMNKINKLKKNKKR
ncbi:hypothetical protein IMG5_060560 [Ichthyophthirius multifiliis]|uniref:Protein kinase domain-containing protein n=1 Tax=Ichthyophthirius multifiliis TaxID=5932 RepID=G0QNP4_ICHMU|nr:hypothetical protein IMG5_060560 [Ichthyophthirius multifiliis]EGR33163.1 hypothetical protein IMG5_060560 [Ichthyophthirius multifiliis]|eukprot:XP_004037149.1 hypothetical protein IMG5_060560 [Ichthyophthirius multifiliis]